MSSNPYAPPESELTNAPEETIRRHFPLWTIGPLPWMFAAILTLVIESIANWSRFGFPSEFLVYAVISAFIASLFAGFYGLIYGFILSRICQALYVTPRPTPHFWTIQAIIFIGYLIQFAGLTTLVFATLAGALMAIFNFQEKVEGKH